jgi:para-aminobenzoate synthetase/4-amino-4-deoxychorismate lyase
VSVTPVRWSLPGRWAPEDVLRAVRADDRPVALVGAWLADRGVRAVVASEPVAVAGPGDDPFAVLADLPAVPDAAAAGPVAAGSVAVGGGWFGYLGYQLNRRLERLPPAPGPPPALPDHALARYDHVMVQDVAGRWWFEALATPARRRALEARHATLARRLTPSPESDAGPRTRPYATAPFVFRPGPDAHARAVATALDHIGRGDVFQANVCLRAESRLDGDPLDLFATGLAALRPAHAAYVRLPEGAVASLSPELFLRVDGRQVRSAPIKGTAVRDEHDPTRAAAQRAALLASAKDRAENVMIVDLVRNDLGRTCAYGSVRVPALVRAEPHPGLWHLVSDVVGELRPGLGPADALRAAFPPGSCTGAPKVRAMQVINDVEATARGVYTGAVGGLSPLAGLVTNVAIRTFEWSAATGELGLGVGGGIVADSRPDAELAECVAKASPVIAAVGGTLAGTVRAPAVPVSRW